MHPSLIYPIQGYCLRQCFYKSYFITQIPLRQAFIFAQFGDSPQIVQKDEKIIVPIKLNQYLPAPFPAIYPVVHAQCKL